MGPADELGTSRARWRAIGLLLAGLLILPVTLRSYGVRQRAEPAVRWRADPGLEGIAAALARDPRVLAPLPGIGPPASVLTRGVTVWVLHDLVPRDSLPLGHAEPWVAGLALPSQAMIAVRADGAAGGLEALRHIARHELAHLALAAVTRDRAPVWLQEGYAQYAAGEWSADEAWRLRFAFARGGESSLQAIELGFPRREADARLAYLLSYTAVAKLEALSGAPGLTRLFERLAAGDSLDEALRRVYGLTEAQFEQAWRREVTARYGWLYVLSRASVFWLVVTLLLLVLGWRRRRYNRERWEALREADRVERAGSASGGDSMVDVAKPSP